jgi:two-component system, cell cycle sensor histidine kinase and response regulator CckA
MAHAGKARSSRDEFSREFAAIVSSSAEAILSKNLQGIVVAWNKGAEDLYGYTAEEMVGQPITKIVPEHLQEETWRFLREITAGRSVIRDEEIRVRKDGSMVQVSLSLSPVRDADGHIIGASTIAHDITDRKRAETLRELLAAVVESSDDAIIGKSMDGTITSWNAGAERLFGYSPFEALGKSVLLLVPPERVREESEIMARIKRGERVDHFETVRLRKDGQSVDISVTVSPIRNNRGVIVGASKIARDITESNRAKERLSAQAAELSQQAEELARSRQALEDKTLLLQSVLDSMSEGLVAADEQGKFVLWNPAAEKIVGMGAAPVARNKWTEHYGIFMPDKVIPFPPEENPLARAIHGETSTAVMYLRHAQRPEGVFVEANASPLRDRNGVVRGGVAAFRDITERRRTEAELQRSEERFSKAFRSSPMPITISTEAEGRYLDVNDAFLRLLGYERHYVIGRTSLDLRFWEEPADRVEMIRQLKSAGQVSGLHVKCRTSGGEIRTVEVSADVIDIDGRRCVLSNMRDITETLQLEAQFRQAQKMEAVGQLAGGVAHDFNNMLGVIMGYSDLSLGLVEPGVPLSKHLAQIKKASERAALLTRQLLTFSRRQVVFPKILDLNEIVNNVTTMLLRMVSEDIAVSFRPTIPLGSISADPGQIEQVLMNLVVNARDAMPGGGSIIIETGHVVLDEYYVSGHPDSHVGAYVVLAVSDTGCGMDEALKAKIFEPFFTTKGVGQGTGLGLSTVYGIVKQNEGNIFVYSELGKGTTFKIYFPRVAAAAEALGQVNEETELLHRSATILVVEDDEPLRTLSVSLLQDAGYSVIEATNAEHALEILKNPQTPIDLLLTDVIMPRKTGVELLAEARLIRPELRSVFMSGYTGDLIALRGGMGPDAVFLEKPFTRTSLLAKIHSTLNSEAVKRKPN